MLSRLQNTVLGALLVSTPCGADEFTQVSFRAADSPIAVESFQCADKNANTLVIEGVVTLQHPSDTDNRAEAKRILILCDTLIFRPGAKLLTKSDLDIRIKGTIYGPIEIESTRGLDGRDATPTPEIWEERTARHGSDGGGGGNGDDAEWNHTSDSGGHGGAGEAGYHGVAGQIGAHGQKGSASSNVHILAAAYGPDTTVNVRAVGGKGGGGGKGGRGENGGNGGRGGNGGKGGDGNEFHGGSSGGNGGNGGDGGNGGNGGTGGNGGDGGAGGNVMVFLSSPEGRPPSDMHAAVQGGIGGNPGEGGDPGLGGKGAAGGSAGCGGSGGRWDFVVFNSGGSCGTNGSQGKDGRPGQKGPPGSFGQDGPNGIVGDWRWGRIDPALAARLYGEKP